MEQKQHKKHENDQWRLLDSYDLNSNTEFTATTTQNLLKYYLLGQCFKTFYSPGGTITKIEQNLSYFEG